MRDSAHGSLRDRRGRFLDGLVSTLNDRHFGDFGRISQAQVFISFAVSDDAVIEGHIGASASFKAKAEPSYSPKVDRKSESAKTHELRR